MRKVLQIAYEPERDRLTWDGWDIHCGQPLEVLMPDRLGGGTWREVSFECNAQGWYMPSEPGVSPVGKRNRPIRAERAGGRPGSFSVWWWLRCC